jgi:O-antigen/teichoic acid export membrane protein
VGDFGLSQSTVRYVAGDVEKHPEQAMRLSQAYVFLKLLGTILVVTLGFLLARPISIWLHLPPESGPLYVRLGIIGVAATAVSGMVSTLLQALRRFVLLVAAQSANITLTVLLMAALFFSGRLTVTSALIIGIMTALAAAIVSVSGTPAYWKRALLPVYHWPADRARRLWGFGRWLWLSAILSILLLQLDLLLVNRLTSPVEAGYYALALNLALKADVLSQTIYLVLLPQVSALTNQAQMSSYVRRSMARGVGLALLLLPVLFLAGPFIVLVYGQTYVQSVPLFLGLLLIVAFDLLVQPLLLTS